MEGTADTVDPGRRVETKKTPQETAQEKGDTYCTTLLTAMKEKYKTQTGFTTKMANVMKAV